MGSSLADDSMEIAATVNIQISLDSLIQAVSSLDIEAKRQLLEVIEQQIFEAEEAAYQESTETVAEIEAVQAEYAQGEFVTVDDFIQSRAN